jgi:hypothetical protein
MYEQLMSTSVFNPIGGEIDGDRMQVTGCRLQVAQGVGSEEGKIGDGPVPRMAGKMGAGRCFRIGVERGYWMIE